jgi:multidrug efflux pump subunit AcrB
MEKRIVTVSERAMTTTVNDIEHIESQAHNGVSVAKVFFQPNVKVELALSQVTAIVHSFMDNLGVQRGFSSGTQYSLKLHQHAREFELHA